MNLMRFKFSRGEALKYVSHLDQQKMFQRAFRRAAVPMAYSAGFNPHPKLAFAQAMAVGMTSSGEYGDVELTEDVAPEAFIRALNRELPEGYRVTFAAMHHEKPRALNAAIVSAAYTVRTETDADETALRQAIGAYMNLDEILTEKRNKKKKLVTMDIKPYLREFSLDSLTDGVAAFEMTMRYIDQKTVSPSALIASFEKESGIAFDREALWRVHRHELVLAEK